MIVIKASVVPSILRIGTMILGPVWQLLCRLFAAPCGMVCLGGQVARAVAHRIRRRSNAHRQDKHKGCKSLKGMGDPTHLLSRVPIVLGRSFSLKYPLGGHRDL